MKISKININNFRLLENVELSLEEKTTVIVGRNNSGKTSLTELFRRLLSDKSPVFVLEDFSLSCHEQFWVAYERFQEGQEGQEGQDESDVRETLPAIEIKLTVSYDEDSETYGSLSEFIIDLNPDCTDTLVNVRYGLTNGKLAVLFEDIEFESEASEDQKKIVFFKAIKERIPKIFTARIYAQDPNDVTNQKDIERSKLYTLLQSGFINAQRGLDDAVRKEGADQKKNNILGSILEQLFSTALNSENSHDQEIVKNLELAINEIQTSIDDGFNVQLVDLLPTFSMFGYPGLSDPNLRTETTLDVQRLLKNHTKVHYAGINGINLPEAYNGLGTRNLIYILLQLLEFYKTFTSTDSISGMHMVFIEEPEAHLHPQMQEVFIEKLGEIADTFARAYEGRVTWPVQFVVTTHSPHMANKASFESMRYFLTHPHQDSETIRTTQIKDLKKGLEGTAQPDKEFLHQYMMLTGCDLLFADKIVLIEGATERIMLPEMMRKIDEINTNDPDLLSQYVSVMEVGGHHAHKFFGLLEFLNLSTLIITDIDSVGEGTKACEVSAGTMTSNSCIKDWFDSKVTPEQLLNKKDKYKIKGRIRLAYQIPEKEQAACGRSFEDAFILANHGDFDLQMTDGTKAYNQAKKIKKTNFAIEHGIEKTSWNVPLYIAEGLQWLAVDVIPPQQIEEQND